MNELGDVKVLFIAGFGPIVRDQPASRQLYSEALGIDFKEEAAATFTRNDRGREDLRLVAAVAGGAVARGVAPRYCVHAVDARREDLMGFAVRASPGRHHALRRATRSGSRYRGTNACMGHLCVGEGRAARPGSPTPVAPARAAGGDRSRECHTKVWHRLCFG
jgi:hypothetical protein